MKRIQFFVPKNISSHQPAHHPRPLFYPLISAQTSFPRPQTTSNKHFSTAFSIYTTTTPTYSHHHTTNIIITNITTIIIPSTKSAIAPAYHNPDDASGLDHHLQLKEHAKQLKQIARVVELRRKELAQNQQELYTTLQELEMKKCEFEVYRAKTEEEFFYREELLKQRESEVQFASQIVPAIAQIEPEMAFTPSDLLKNSFRNRWRLPIIEDLGLDGEEAGRPPTILRAVLSVTNFTLPRPTR